MAGIPTLSYSTPLDRLREEWLYTQARLQADARAQAVASKLAGFDAAADQALEDERALRDQVTLSNARVDGADATLDSLVDKVDAALLGAVGKDRSNPVYQSFFGTLTVHAFKRPVLGPELASIAAWPARLAAQSEPALQSLSTPVEQAVGAGQAAAAAQSQADLALEDFERTGAARKLVDQLNAMRGDAYGALLKMRHDHPEWGLPARWAESFFQHAERGARLGQTVSRATEHVASLQERLQKANAHVADLQAKEAERRKAAAEHQQAHAAAKQARETARAAAKAATAAAKKAQKKRG